ncbi:hypothetical protein JOF50_000564 [Corynebacterium mucifaciens]|uniref:Secreted protein n=1 Tax=Corynebacterium mucifaciens TaxID=57171 RepID=A0ABV2NW03_9CORY
MNIALGEILIMLAVVGVFAAPFVLIWWIVRAVTKK